MKENRPRISLGTLLVLSLTVIVTVGCVWLFAKIRSDNPDARMNAQKMMGVLGDALYGPTPVAVPQATVRTVTVTLAPAVQPRLTPMPTQAMVSSTSATPQRAEQAPFSFTLTAGGLLGFQSDVSDSVYEKSSKTFDYQPILKNLGYKVYADLNLVTLSNVLNVQDHKYADVIAPVMILDAVKAGGFDHILLNTEHVLDQGTKGALETRQAISSQGFSASGINAGTGTQHQLIQINGGKIALLAYTDTLTNKGKNALETQEGHGMMTMLDLDDVRRDIAWAKAQGAGCIIISLHWGREDTASVTSAQRETARMLASMGADLILGTHPSRVLPLEVLDVMGEDGTARKTLVAYSLGTLLTESRNGYDISGALIHLNIVCDGRGKVAFQNVEYTPTYIWRQSVDGKMQYRVICSADPPPDGMDTHQQEVMGRALTRIQNSLAGSPITQRK